MKLAIIEDEIISYEQLPASYCDRGLYFGDGVYEVVRSYDGQLFAFEEHMQRFGQSLAAIGIDNVDLGDIRKRIRSAFEKSGIANAKIYWHITRGRGPRDHVGGPDLKPCFFMTITELNENAAAQVKARGMKVSTFPDWRWRRCDIKSLNLLANVLAARDASSKGCDEAILYNEQGYVTEGSSSAFFVIFDNKLQTTPLSENILPSITRIFVLECAKAVGLELVQKPYIIQEARGASEMFIAVTTRDIVGVIQFDDAVIGDGKVGSWTGKLTQQFKANRSKYCS
ncbi:MAG: hypothetical protein A2Y07_00050 [Planctomycetes bacterium GWF2_50_10]|nr:MAG: hypothetical protein A2Y07_00050 [Planctomycetes bacterium GWF2_50_10]